MKHIYTIIFCLFCLGNVAGAWSQGQPSDGAGPVTHIIIYKSTVDPDTKTNALARAHGLGVRFIYRHALKGAAVVIPPGRLRQLENDPAIDYIEEEQITTVDAQILPTGVDRVDADINATANINGVNEFMDADIAVLDTGVDLDHPDLNIHQFVYCSGNGPQQQNPQCIENDSRADDGHGHGTHVSGTAAAVDNTVNVVGVAPGARIWAVKVCTDSGSCASSLVLAGIDYVTANASQIEVANMSLTFGPSTAINQAVANSVSAGVVYTLAAGNSKIDVVNVSPAGEPSAITVSAFADFDGQAGATGSGSVSFGAPASCTENQDDSFACLSNFGSGVDIMAPGIRINSTWKGGGSATIDGTSMAAPHVAGAVALYLIDNPGDTPAQVKAGLIATGDLTPCGSGSGTACSDDPDGIQEPLLFVGPNCADADSDGICDSVDNCLLIANTGQENNDNDSEGDVCDADDDNDGLSDVLEQSIGTDPFDTDSDNDGLSDFDEVNYDGNAASYTPGLDTDPLNADTDADSLDDIDEINIHLTDPLNADSDGDGLSDGDELNLYLTDPLVADSDGDTLSDGAEVNIHGTDPNIADTDSDGLGDADEVNVHGTNANVADTDTDGLNDGEEINTYFTDPLLGDSDGDGLSDGDEVNIHGTNPNSADTDGDTFNDKAEIDASTDPLSAASYQADGDVNMDGMVDAADVVVSLRVMQGATSLNAQQLLHADVAPLAGGLPASNGIFDLADVVVIQRKVNGAVSF